MLYSRTILKLSQNFCLNNFCEVEFNTLEGSIFHICIAVSFQNSLINSSFYSSVLNTVVGIFMKEKACLFFFFILKETD